MDKQTKMANRYGLDIKFYDYNSNGTLAQDAKPVATVTFANEVSMELSSEVTWATGGQNHANRIGFKDPTEGTFSISTQLVTMELLGLAAGMDVAKVNDTISFTNDKESATPKSYIIKGTTVWQGEDGSTYYEEVTAYKAVVKPGYSVTYNGSGDPQSLDIEFELGTNDAGKIVDIKRGATTEDSTENDGDYDNDTEEAAGE